MTHQTLFNSKENSTRKLKSIRFKGGKAVCQRNISVEKGMANSSFSGKLITN